MTNSYTIEKGIPVPPARTCKGSHKYPFARMDVGDSVAIHPADGETLKIVERRAWGNATRITKKVGYKFAVRILPDENCVRVWRTE